MHSELVDAPQKTKDRFGLIVFVGGNDERVPKEQRKLTYHSVRFCTVRDAFFDDDTEQLLVILELNQFVRCEFEVRQRPPDIFVTPGKITECEPSTWLECVRRLESYYPDTLFFRLNRVFAKTEVVSPTYLSDFRLSRFDLLEETDYSLECIYYDPSGQGNLPLSIECDSDQIEISNTFASGAGADLDKRLIHLKTGLLTSRSARAFITFSSCSTDRSVDPNHVQTLWEIQRKGSKPWKFAGCVLVGALGLARSSRDTRAQCFLYPKKPRRRMIRLSPRDSFRLRTKLRRDRLLREKEQKASRVGEFSVWLRNGATEFARYVRGWQRQELVIFRSAFAQIFRKRASASAISVLSLSWRRKLSARP